MARETADEITLPSWPTSAPPPHEEALAALDVRSRLDTGRASFDEVWPPDATVDAWIEAALIDAALACTNAGEPKVTAAHARTLVVQAKRGFGWGNSEHRVPVQARAAAVAALVGEWDLVAKALGGRPLARTVVASKTYDGLGGLVRHVATAARHGLGEEVCRAALVAFAKGPACEPALLFALARLALEGAGGHPRSEVPTRFFALLEDRVATPRARPRAAPIDDPRVSIFERFMSALSDQEARAGLLEWQSYVRELPAGRSFDTLVTRWVSHAWLLGMDAEVAALMPVLSQLRPASTGSEPTAAFVFLAMLGHPVDDWRAQLLRELRPFKTPRKVTTLRRYRWSTAAAAVALAAGDTALVKTLTPGPKKERFQPGKSFGDEPRSVLRYFALAIDAGASQADVQKAWLELLATRVPDGGDQGRTGGAWGWTSLCCLAFAYFHVIGGAAEQDVLHLLRRTLRGETLV